MPIPTLETARLRLRPHRPDDFEAYAAMWRDPRVVRFIGGVPFSREQSWARFVRQAGMWQLMGFGFLALEDRQTGRFVGEAGFHEVRRDMRPSIEGTLETGWGLVGEAQGRGLAEEAVRAMIAWGEASIGGRLMTCIIEPGNAASLRVAEKVGFRPAGSGDYGGTALVVLHRRPRGDIEPAQEQT